MIAHRFGPQRARQGLKRVMDWGHRSANVARKLNERRRSASRGMEGMPRRVDWEALRRERRMSKPATEDGQGAGVKKCSTLLCGLRRE